MPSALRSAPRLVRLDPPVTIFSMEGPRGLLDDWIRQVIDDHPVDWLYADLDDGIVWGRIDDHAEGKRVLTTGADVVRKGQPALPDEQPEPPPLPEPWVPRLRLATLHALWLFGAATSIQLRRRSDRAFEAVCFASPAEAGASADAPWFEEAFEHTTLLYGTHALRLASTRFAYVEDQSAVVAHVLPLLPATGANGVMTQAVGLVQHGYRPRLDPAVPDTHLGHPIRWRPVHLVLTPRSIDLSD